jgi:SecD/SecF fusion protein
MVVSCLGIVAYVWFRFEKLMYGLAAIIATIHDVFAMLAAIALSHWVYGFLGFAGIEDFKINMIEVAAFLTIIGYSLNDTVVVFDRIREVKGKSPTINGDLVNISVNQTLSRTILTSLTTLIVIVILYIFGGQSLRGFSFALMVGVITGTYSSIFIAAPILLWMSRFGKTAQVRTKAAA